jgi:LysR family transcriptional regulator, transcription activator of glutamate synthase operon
MNLKQLEYFVAVAESLNFTKAARKFYISQTAITKQIMALEAMLETRLFNRTKHHVELTPAGIVFLNEAKAILNRAAEAMERVHLATGGISGSLNIGFVKGYEKTSFSDLILDFHKEYPNIFMSFTRNNAEELYRAVESRDLDIVFTISHTGRNEELVQRSIRKYPLAAVVYPEHPLASRASLRLEELKNEELLLMDASFPETRRGIVFKDYLADQSMPLITQQSRDPESILLMVSANMGVAVLPSYVVKYLNHSRHLIIIPLEDEVEMVEIAACWNRNNSNPALGMFLRKLEGL